MAYSAGRAEDEGSYTLLGSEEEEKTGSELEA
jgi:hypothetical protein